MVKVYGIPNCDTVKKTLKFLKDSEIDFEFFDFKKEPPTEKQIHKWRKAMKDWPVNRRGRTFRAISEDFESASDSEKIEILIENSSSIKRPIVENGSKVVAFGHDESVLKTL